MKSDRKSYPSRRAEALRAYRIRRRAHPERFKCICSFPAVGFCSGGDPICARCRDIEAERYGDKFKAA